MTGPAEAESGNSSPYPFTPPKGEAPSGPQGTQSTSANVSHASTLDAAKEAENDLSSCISSLFLIAGLVGLVLHRHAMQPAAAAAGGLGTMPATAAADQSKPSEPGSEFSPTMPLLVDVAQDLAASFEAEALNAELMKVRRTVYFDLGVPFPGINLRFNDQLAPGSYAILLHEVPVATGELRPQHLFARASEDTLKALGVEFESGRRFLPNLPTLWVRQRLRKPLAQTGTGTMDATQLLTYHLAFVLKKYAADFIGIQETCFLLAQMEAHFPDLVKEAQRVMAVQKIAEILQRLVSEETSIRNLRTILEALVEWGQKERDSVLLTEYTRAALKRHLSHKYSTGQNFLPAYLFAPNVEETIRGAIRQSSVGSYLALDPNVSRRLLESIKKTVGDVSKAAQRPVLLTSMDIRRYVRKMIEQDLYELPVLSYQELTQDVNVQPLARVEMA